MIQEVRLVRFPIFLPIMTPINDSYLLNDVTNSDGDSSMRIIVISNNAWDDRNSVGNTMSNWFDEWPGAEFSSIYSREVVPNNNCCDNYFVVSLSQIVRYVLMPWKIGERINNTKINSKESKETYLVNATRGKSIKRLFVIINELLFASRIWMNKRIKDFIHGTNPDVCFTFAIGEPFRYHLCKYLKKHSVPVILFVADDVYGVYKRSRGLVPSLQKRRFEKLIELADKAYGASDMLCRAYSEIFGISIKELYKGCNLMSPKNYINTPIKITYAGNLFYGRSETLGLIAKVLTSINKKNGVLAQLEIYTGTPINKDLESRLGKDGVLCIKGERPYTEITRILKESDIVLHVESFEEKQKDIVRYSFSTKIIDCIQSGSVLMVVGPRNIASVEYTRSLKGSVVIDDLDNLEDVLWDIVNNPNDLIERAVSINEIAVNTFQIDKVRERIHADFAEIVNK